MDTYADLVGKKVRVKHSDKTAYARLIGMQGVVERASGSTIGVRIDDMNNECSAYGVFWFTRNEIKVLDEERKDTNMKDFKYVAVVKLLDSSYSNKEYAFAMYDEDFAVYDELLSDKYEALVVVSTRYNNRALGRVDKILTVEDFHDLDKYKGINVTAEVIGVVNTRGFEAREAEKVRLKELAKKKAAIEKELEAEINKRKSIEYYEAMAKEYSDNPKLAELVAELKQLGM